MKTLIVVPVVSFLLLTISGCISADPKDFTYGLGPEWKCTDLIKVNGSSMKKLEKQVAIQQTGHTGKNQETRIIIDEDTNSYVLCEKRYHKKVSLNQ